MKLNSLILDSGKLIPIEVELTLWPGLPGIQFTGLADRHVKESALRIKSAIRSQGFEFPKFKQILVNLKPSYLKKTSRGLELAVAAAYLMETEQIPKFVCDQKTFFYGELGLDGSVVAPEDLQRKMIATDAIYMTGSNLEACDFETLQVGELKGLQSPIRVGKSRGPKKWNRPNQFIEHYFSKKQADLLKLLALGRHSCLIAGPAGAGKSTLAQVVHSLLPTPTDGDELNYFLKYPFETENDFYPLVLPHYRTPVAAMIGGGNSAYSGELTRGHGGVLIMDEFLEFDFRVLESLRSILEDKFIRISRQGKSFQYLAETQVIATTNLCPCGQWSPLHPNQTRCRFSLLKCRSYSQRFSGPLLDRFEIIFFAESNQELNVSWAQIHDELEIAYRFRVNRFREIAFQLEHEVKILTEEFSRNSLDKIYPELSESKRRRNALLRVSRCFADLRQSQEIEIEDVQKARPLTHEHFEKLQRWGI